MPVSRSRSVRMLDDDIISIRPVLPVPSTTISILFNTHHHSFTSSSDPCTAFHFEIQGCSFFVGEWTEISLHKAVLGTFFIRQGIHITAVVFNLSFLKQFDFFSERI